MKPGAKEWTNQALDYPPQGALGRGLDVKASRACQLADTLAWAVTRGIPIPDALRSLPFYRPLRPGRLEFHTGLAWSLVPTFYWMYIPWLNDLRWTARINHVIKDLENGHDLGPTLQWWLGRFVPAFYLQGIMRAESNQALEAALPILAEQMSYPLTVTRRRFLASLASIIEILCVAWMVLFLFTFITPRLQEILADMDVYTWIPSIPGRSLTYLGLLLSSLTLWAGGLVLLPRLGRWGEKFSHRIPWVGPNRRRFLILDVARTLCAYLRQGDDLLTAAVWAEKCTPSYWLKRRLGIFTECLRGGEPWLVAWEKARLGGTLESWALRNADSREDPASGFELIAQWKHQQIEATTSRLERWVAPITTLILGACIGTVAVSFFRALTLIIGSVM